MASKTLLQIIQQFCLRRGLDKPGTVIGSADDTHSQLGALANEVLTDLLNRGSTWPGLEKEATFTSVAAELQGSLSTIAPYGFKFVIPGTLYNRTERRELFGPRNGPEWQASEALPTTGPFYSFRVWQGNFYLQPAPPAGHTIAFEYASDMAVRNSVDGVWRKAFEADDDLFQLDEDLLYLGLNWKWRREKGLSYSQEKQDYEYLVASITGNNSTKPALSLSGAPTGIRPGVIVPSGNWNV